MKHPVIRYQGNLVRVTPDTAREMVDSGAGVLVEGDLQPEPEPAAKPKRKSSVRKPKAKK